MAQHKDVLSRNEDRIQRFALEEIVSIIIGSTAPFVVDISAVLN